MRDKRNNFDRLQRDTEVARINRNKPINSMAMREQQQSAPVTHAAGITGNFTVRSARRQGLK